MVFVITPPFLLIPATSFSIGTEKSYVFFSIFPKQVNCPSNSYIALLR